ncbi:hypothetical protein O1L60_43320 [Streptomyces diastatochromogenes]|nr:hypothetical protein [Streptomyces diastatochromogenes]
MRLVESPYYSDAALNVYIKVKALGLRLDGCTAGLKTLASYLELSPSTVKRGLAELRSPAPDGVIELPDSRRRSLPGGCGTTARRRVRPLTPNERYIWLPVVTSEHLRPRALRAYAVIAYCVVRNIPLTETVLANFLRHHSGRRAGRPITVEAAGRIVDELEESGWISLQRRAGHQGRHLFLVHDQPTGLSSVSDDPSGPPSDDPSLTYKEDLRIDRPENETPLVSPAVGEVQVEKQAKPVENRLATPRLSGTPGDDALRAGDKTTPSPKTPGTGAKPYRGPQPTFSPRVHAVLEPVRFLLSDVNAYMQRRIAREISRQIDDGMGVERLQARLTLRLARTMLEDIQDIGRWLLGVALPHWGCANPDCEAGVLWSTGMECRACRQFHLDRAADKRAAVARAAAAAAPRQIPEPRPAPPVRRIVEQCPNCHAPHHFGNSGLCKGCRPDEEPTQDPGPDAAISTGCPGRDGTCGRPAPNGLCWRCRVQWHNRPVPPQRVPQDTRQAPQHHVPTGTRHAPHP